MATHKIREIIPSDAPWIFDACQDSQTQFWTTIPRPYLLKHAHAYANGEIPEYKIWVIETEDSRPVGLISIHAIDMNGDADLGYMVAPWGRGQGAAKDAINLVEKYAQDDPRIVSLVACISDINMISQKVAESSGLVKSEVAERTCPAGDIQTSAHMYRKTI